MKFHEVTEVIGLALILVSVGWELFFTTTLDSMEKGLELDRLHDKLNQLYQRQSQLQQHLDFKVAGLMSETPVHGAPLSKEWNPAPFEEGLKRVETQARRFRRAKVALFATGSAMLIFAKLLAYSNPSPAPKPVTILSTPVVPPTQAQPQSQKHDTQRTAHPETSPQQAVK